MKTVYLYRLLLLLLSMSFFYGQTFSSADFNPDFAISLGIVNKMFQGEFPLMGPSSHVGGRHPGPLYYYLLGSQYTLSFFSEYILGIVQGISKLAAVFAVIYIASWYLSYKQGILSLLLLLAVILLNSAEVYSLLLVPWHGNDIVFAGLLLFFGLTINLKQKNYLILIFCSVMALQLHTIAIPLIIATFILQFFYREKIVVEVPELVFKFCNHRISKALMIILLLFSLLSVTTYLLYYNNLGSVLPDISSKVNMESFLNYNMTSFKLVFMANFWMPVLFFLSVISFFVIEKKDRALLSLAVLLQMAPVALLLFFVLFNVKLDPYLLNPYRMFFYAGSFIILSLLVCKINKKSILIRCIYFFTATLIISVQVYAHGFDPNKYRAKDWQSEYSLSKSLEIAQCLKRSSYNMHQQLFYVGAEKPVFKNSILYWLGPEYFSLMKGQKYYPELIDQNSKPEEAYLVLTDGYSKMKKIEKNWEIVSKIPTLAGCTDYLIYIALRKQ